MNAGGRPQGSVGVSHHYRDTEAELAFHKLMLAALDQRAPSKALVRRLNTVLTLIAHPSRDRSLDTEAL